MTILFSQGIEKGFPCRMDLLQDGFAVGWMGGMMWDGMMPGCGEVDGWHDESLDIPCCRRAKCSSHEIAERYTSLIVSVLQNHPRSFASFSASMTVANCRPTDVWEIQRVQSEGPQWFWSYGPVCGTFWFCMYNTSGSPCFEPQVPNPKPRKVWS